MCTSSLSGPGAVMDSPLRERISLGRWYFSCVPTAVKIPGLSITQLPLMMEMSLWVSRAGGKSHVHLGVCHSEKSSAFPVSVFVCLYVRVRMRACVCVYPDSFGSFSSPVC